jgi:hypothetical protein
MAQSGAANQCIADMFFKAVCFVCYRGDSALGVIRVGFRFFFFRDNGYRSELCHFDGQTQTGDAAADNLRVVQSSSVRKSLFTNPGRFYISLFKRL